MARPSPGPSMVSGDGWLRRRWLLGPTTWRICPTSTRSVWASRALRGYMTTLIIGRTDRFKAAMAQRVVSNFLSFCGSSDLNWTGETAGRRTVGRHGD